MITSILATVLLLMTAAAEENPVPVTVPAHLHLAEAVLCEKIDNFKPVNPSLVFSVSLGKVTCFTEFDVVPQKMEVYHDWIKKDKSIFRKKLLLKPPRWSSISTIQLREADKGPWRVEVRDAGENLITTLRFSITE
jgi:hypothetical protein